MLVQLASSYESKIYVQNDDRKVNAKSIMGMMTLDLPVGEQVVVTADGVDEEKAINDIEKYKGKSLFVERKDAVPLEEDEYYIADMIGMKVMTDEGEEFGTLKDVMETGANDVYVIEMKDGKEVLIPAIKQCVLDIDVEKMCMTIHVMEGLL